MDATCAACESTFEAKTSRAKYCSEKCKRRFHRGARPASATAADSPAASSTATTPPAGAIASVETATMLTLAEANRLGTPLGQTALMLARRLDASQGDTGAGVASLAKQLQSTLEAATANAARKEDPVDELERRRQEKLGATATG